MSFNPFINGGGGTSSEDKVARAEIAAIKDGETLDSFSDVETALDDKADSTTTYTKTEVDTALGNKADKSTTYTKTEVDTALGNKVDKVSGKGLSTNDYTDVEKTKLAGIAEGAEVNEIESIKVNNTTVNPDVNKVVNITVPTTAADVSALPDTTKYAVALSLTINSSTYVMTGQLKDQNGDNLGTAQTIDLPLESVVVDGSYDNQTKKVILTLQNGNTIEFSVADLVSGLQTELSTSNKLNPAFIEYDSTHRAVSDTEKSAWNSKQSALTAEQLAAVNSGITFTDVAQIATNASDILDIQAQADWNTDNGVKNLLDFETWKSLPITRGTSVISGNSITLTATGDNCCTPHTVAGGFPENAKIYVKPNTTYKFTWDCDATASKNGQVYIFPNDTDFVYSFASSKVLLFTTTANTTYLTFRIGVANTGDSITYSNLMIRPALISDTTYQPYAMSNAELTAVKQNALSSAQLDAVNSGIDSTKVEQIETNKNNILFNTNQGVKNLFNLTKVSGTYSSVVFTVNSDKTVTVNGTASPANSVFNLDDWTCTKAGTYVISGAPSGGSWTPSPNTYRIRVAVNGTWKGDDVGNGYALTLAVGDVVNLQINTSTSYTANNLVFKPMITLKSLYDADPTYQPYAPSNRELYEMILAMQ